VSRRLLLVAAALLLALAGMGAVGLLRDEPGDAEARAAQLAAELRCPDCQALSVAESDTPAAVEIRRQIAELLAAGQTSDQVRQHFVARYGEWILLAPRSPVPWLLPFVALAAGLAALAAWPLLGRRVGNRAPRAARASEERRHEAERRRVRDELESLDA
jgi:cytochrome c-type biogenesis protein CcmH